MKTGKFLLTVEIKSCMDCPYYRKVIKSFDTIHYCSIGNFNINYTDIESKNTNYINYGFHDNCPAFKNYNFKKIK